MHVENYGRGDITRAHQVDTRSRASTWVRLDLQNRKVDRAQLRGSTVIVLAESAGSSWRESHARQRGPDAVFTATTRISRRVLDDCEATTTTIVHVTQQPRRTERAPIFCDLVSTCTIIEGKHAGAVLLFCHKRGASSSWGALLAPERSSRVLHRKVNIIISGLHVSAWPHVRGRRSGLRRVAGDGVLVFGAALERAARAPLRSTLER